MVLSESPTLYPARLAQMAAEATASEPAQALSRLLADDTLVMMDAQDALALWYLEGPDAVDYLQRRTTQDVAALAVGHGAACALLDARATLQAVFYALRTGPTGFLLVADVSQAATLPEVLLKFKLVETFTLTALDPLAWRWQVVGDLALVGRLLAHHPEVPLAALTGEGSLLLRGAAPAVMAGWDPGCQDVSLLLVRPWCVAGHGGLPLSVLLSPNAVACGAQGDLETLVPGVAVRSGRLGAVVNTLLPLVGVPLVGRDVQLGAPFAQARLMDASVSFTKGCYPGQEVVAKVKTYGRVPKGLCALRLSQQPEENAGTGSVQARVGDGWQEAGEVVSWLPGVVPGEWLVLTALLADYRTVGATHTLRLKDAPAAEPFTGTVLPWPVVSLGGEAALSAQLDEALRCHMNDDVGAALRLLRQAAALCPTHQGVLEALGVVLGRRAEASEVEVWEAIRWMDRLQEVNPDHLLTFTNRSTFYLKLGDKERAEDEKAKGTVLAFSQKFKAGKTAPVGTDTPAQQLEPPALTDTERAALLEKMTLFENALQFYPDDPLAMAGLAEAAAKVGDDMKALGAYERLLAGPNPSLAQLEGAIGVMMRLSQFVKAGQAIERALGVAAKRQDKAAEERLLALRAKVPV